MIKRTFKRTTWILGIFLAVNVALGLITNVPTHVTESDQAVVSHDAELEEARRAMDF